MKRLSTLVLVLALFVTTSYAQKSTRLPHRLSVSYQDALWPTVGVGLNSILVGSFFGMPIDHIHSPGSFNLGYQFISKSERWGYGLNIGYTPISYNSSKVGVNSTPTTMHLVGITPTVECYYLKKGIVRLYGSVGLGLSMGISEGETAYGVDFQFNPIAMRVGTNRIAGFLSLGIGMRGLVGVGLQVGL